MKSKRELKLERLLTQFIQPIKNIPFELIIQALFGFSVKKFDLKAYKNILHKMSSAMSKACKTVEKNPIMRSRPNEAGNDMEGFVLSALKGEGLKAGSPKTVSGRGKSVGYPDIKIETDTIPIYLEVKTHSKNQRNTSLRSFYLSPAKESKVAEDAFHLLVCFEMIRKDNQFLPAGFKLIDLYGLDCDMKLEFNSDNKRLYQANRLLSQGNSSKFKLKTLS